MFHREWAGVEGDQFPLQPTPTVAAYQKQTPPAAPTAPGVFNTLQHSEAVQEVPGQFAQMHTWCVGTGSLLVSSVEGQCALWVTVPGPLPDLARDTELAPSWLLAASTSAYPGNLLPHKWLPRCATRIGFGCWCTDSAADSTRLGRGFFQWCPVTDKG